MTEERRKHSRIAFHTPATLIFPEMTVDTVVLDLSLKGALVRLPAGVGPPCWSRSASAVALRAMRGTVQCPGPAVAS